MYGGSCSACKVYGNAAKRGEDACLECRVDLLPENFEAARLYQLCRRQIRTFHNGQSDKELDLDFTAVKTVMDLYEVKDQRRCFDLITRTYYHFLEERNRHAGS